MKKYFDIEEIKKHNKQNDCWIICCQKVYNITDLIDKHPGGKSCLLKRGGGVLDCLKDYNFHSKNTKKKWEKYCIGYIKEYKNSKNNFCNII